MRLVRSCFLLFFSFLLASNAVTGYPESELTVCVVATRLNDDSYDFSLESGDDLQYIPGYDFLIPAAAWFNKSLDDLGMSFQTIKSSGEFDDTIQAYWAGFLELYTSREMTYAHLENTFGGFILYILLRLLSPTHFEYESHCKLPSDQVVYTDVLNSSDFNERGFGVIGMLINFLSTTPLSTSTHT
ncbi:hypothetical protein ACTXT7_017098, partial [Hymenolepis weldensis]